MLKAKYLLVIFALICTSTPFLFGQETPPASSAPKAARVPPVVERKLSNGLTIASVERKAVPLVTIQLLVKSGASEEAPAKAGLADITASMLTKGTKTRSATQVAEAIEFLGGTINSGAGWNSWFVSVTVTSDKVDQAMAILADVVLNPKFDQKELDLLKSQTLDELTNNLKQPSFLANYVASKYSFGEHPAGGTPDSIKGMTRDDIVAFHTANFRPDDAVLIFTGDIAPGSAEAISQKAFGTWKSSAGSRSQPQVVSMPAARNGASQTILVVDLPKSGQAAVTYAKPLMSVGRKSNVYYPAQVLNSVLGGGYSSRLNYEIRIKRGLSYGAGSSFAWRPSSSDFSTRTQTKNESAAEVVGLVLDEVKKLGETSVGNEELVPRKSVLTGNFGRNLETTAGLATAVGELYAFGIPTSELNAYVTSVNGVSDSEIKSFASGNLSRGDIIIVGDYSVFKDDLAKRFPKTSVDVIKADDLDLSKDNLHK